MPKDSRVLVVGTTGDYIAYLHQHYGGRALFVTAATERAHTIYAPPDPCSEVTCRLDDFAEVRAQLDRHLSRWNQELLGVTCYDCETLLLAADLAQHLRLPFPTPQAIVNSRSKLISKQLWRQAGLDCPRAEIVPSREAATRFAEDSGCPMVLKPLTGSGSELVFVCRNPAEAGQAFDYYRRAIAERQSHPLYAAVTGGCPEPVALAEEFIAGPEYSCDFILDQGRVIVVRVAEKLKPAELPFGTTESYIVPGRLPQGVTAAEIGKVVGQAAIALGLARTLAMADFVIQDGRICLLELTPRPGGDCLPPLIRHACGLDMLAAALDFAEGKNPSVTPWRTWRTLVGRRLFAPQSGRVTALDTAAILSDDRVCEVDLKRSVGHQVVLPPKDYNSWQLGYVIFEPHDLDNCDREGREIGSKLTLKMESCDDRKDAGVLSSRRSVG